MNPCEQWSGALEKAATGALEADEASALEAHLRGCAACREAHEALVGLREALPPEAPPPEIDWNRFRPRFEAADRSYRRDLRRGILAALVFGAAFFVGHGLAAGSWFDDFGLGVLAGVGLGMTAVLVWAWTELRRARGFAEGDLFALLERRYRRRIRTLSWFPFVYPPLFAAVMWFALPRMGGGPRAWAVVIAAFAIACLASAWGFGVARRRLKRELARLRGEP